MLTTPAKTPQNTLSKLTLTKLFKTFKICSGNSADRSLYGARGVIYARFLTPAGKVEIFINSLTPSVHEMFASIVTFL